jgi:DNA-damage-inducible protein J
VPHNTIHPCYLAIKVTTYVRARIDTNTKARATGALRAMGLSISDTLRMLRLRVADEQRLPFDVKVSTTTRMAISELEAGKGKKFTHVDDLIADLHADDGTIICIQTRLQAENQRKIPHQAR